MAVSWLPTFDATMNAIATVLIVIGLVLIKRGHRQAHIRFMVAAMVVSALFLTGYLIHKSQVGTTHFGHEGQLIRTVYLTILWTHTPLAAALVPLLWVTVGRALRGRFAEHKRIAPWTAAVWLYVSVTGVVIYFILYRWYP